VLPASLPGRLATLVTFDRVAGIHGHLFYGVIHNCDSKFEGEMTLGRRLQGKKNGSNGKGQILYIFAAIRRFACALNVQRTEGRERSLEPKCPLIGALLYPALTDDYANGP